MGLKTYIEVQDNDSNETIDFYSYDGNTFTAFGRGYIEDIGSLETTLQAIEKLTTMNCTVLAAYSYL